MLGENPVHQVNAGLKRERTLPTRHGQSGWDLSAALAYVGDDRQLLAELLAIFVTDSPAHIQALRDAVSSADAAEFTRVAHMMKGELRTLGAVEATSFAERLEALGRRGSLDDAPALLTGLEREVGGLLAYIAAEEWQ